MTADTYIMIGVAVNQIQRALVTRPDLSLIVENGLITLKAGDRIVVSAGLPGWWPTAANWEEVAGQLVNVAAAAAPE